MIAFLPMEIGVDPGTSRIGDILAEIVGVVPAPSLGEPEGLGGDIQPGGWGGILESGAGKRVDGHGELSLVENGLG